MGFISVLPQGFKQQALAVSTDPEHRFELALQLGELKIAYQLAVEAEVRRYCSNASLAQDRYMTLLSSVTVQSFLTICFFVALYSLSRNGSS